MRIQLILFILVLSSCAGESPVPRPVGYFRIDLPEKAYEERNLECPFRFEISKQSRLEYTKENMERCWFDISYPDLNARVHITYKPVDNNLREFIEESRSLAYEHQVKASRISPKVIAQKEKDVYGLAYDLGGKVASPYQFYLTDSTRHFLRGSLYFMARPNPDSLEPVLNYVREDLDHFIESFEWK
jgi:gliding motility-associated lipoprotein GldD